MFSFLLANYMLLILVSIVIAMSAGYLLIPVLRRIKMGQFVREDGPQSHLKKAGTPTMGGIIFLIPVIVQAIVSGKVGAIFWVMLACGVIGFADDYIKVVLKRSLGLRAYQKLAAQLLVMIAFFVYKYYQGTLSTQITIPFLKNEPDLGVFFYVFVFFVILGTINGANLTDGLDGLSASVTMSMTFYILIISVVLGHGELSVISLALIGGLIGFLWFNSYPAKVFMGDTGSLALGGFIAFASIELKVPLFIAIFGIIYLVESLSVMLQVAYFKKTGKRIFKMTPIHHHFELSGYRETKIVTMFSIITLMGCLISLIGYLIRV